MDPIFLPLRVIGSFAEKIGGPISQFMIAGAATKNARVNEERLAHERERFAFDRASAIRRTEEFYLAQTHQVSMQLRELEARQYETDHRDQLQHWPIPIRPMAIVKASTAKNRKALNVILVVTGNCDDHTLNQAKRLLLGAPFSAMRKAERMFNGDLQLYSDQTNHRSPLSGTGLRSTLCSLLCTEPTVLLEINVIDVGRFDCWFSHWGCAFDVDEDPSKVICQTPGDPLHFDMTKTSPESWGFSLSFTFSSILVGLGDSFRALQRPYELHDPVFPWLLNANPSLALTEDQLSLGAAPSYLKAIDQVAAYDAGGAVELAAKYALVAHNEQLPTFAEKLGDKSMRLLPIARSADVNISAQDVANWTAKQPSRKFEYPHLRKMLEALYGISVENSSSDGLSLREIARLNNANLDSN